MKKVLYLFLGLCFSSQISAQEIRSYLISSAGASHMNENGALYISVGEPLNTEIQDGEIMISQGFLNMTILEQGSTATDDLIEEIIHTYPNPTIESITIEIPEISSSLTMEVFDESGRIIQKETLTEKVSNLSVTDWNAGTYYLNVRDGDKKSKTLKIIKL